MKSKDNLFADKKEIDDFTFDSKTATVFDDMVGRSVPFYPEIQRMIGEIAQKFYVPGTNIYDLGCSTGNTILNIANSLNEPARFIGCDYSHSMLEKAKEKINNNKFTCAHKFEYKHFDLNESIELDNVSVAIMCLTMQFVRPINRGRIVKVISNALMPEGVFIMVEKVVCSSSILNRMFIDFHLSFKKREGYSDLEIAQKREALENILIPYRLEENIKLISDAGFQNIEIFFKWYNWIGMLAFK